MNEKDVLMGFKQISEINKELMKEMESLNRRLNLVVKSVDEINVKLKAIEQRIPEPVLIKSEDKND